MLRIFRTLRQRLLTENKFSKFLLYAVGEILLVVIGILIALQVDNWNEERRENDQIRAQLANLLRDLNNDRAGLQQLRSFHAFRVHAANYLLDQYSSIEKVIPYPEAGPPPELDQGGIFGGKIPDSYDKDFVVRAFSWLVRLNTIGPATEAIDEFKSTGLYAIYVNHETKDKIRGYYAGYGFAFSDREGEAYSIILKNTLASNGYSYLDIALLDNPIEELLSIPSIAALLKNIIDESTFRSNRASFLIENLEELILEMESEINQEA